jgi:putative addiction module killer protein
MDVKIYRDSRGKEPFIDWLDSRKDVTTQRRIRKKVRRVESGNLGDYASVGEGVYELRLHFGPGYRLYYGYLDAKTILLLVGGEKSTQDHDIAQAQDYWKEHQRSMPS